MQASAHERSFEHAMISQDGSTPRGRSRALHIVWLIAALIYASPIAVFTYQKLTQSNVEARERLIQQHRLWESQPGFRGKPEIWTRMASRLLNNRQLLSRVANRYGGASQEFEVEYRRDLAIARTVIVLTALAAWGIPVGLAYGALRLFDRRRTPAPQKVQPASVLDRRYRPPDEP